MGLRIIFMGTPDFAVPSLKALLTSSHKVVAVYTQPPRKAGRGMGFQKSPVHEIAEKNKIPVFTPENFKKESEIKNFQNLEADLAVVTAYGHILPERILKAPRFGCINIHASLLPGFRGAAPIQRTIQTGQTQSGNTVIQMVPEMDAGPIITQKAFKLENRETSGTLHEKLKSQAADIILDAIDEFAEKRKKPKAQNPRDVTFAGKIIKKEARIDWTRSAKEIDRHVRAFNPWPGAFFMLDGIRIKVLDGRVEKFDGDPREALDERLLIACGTDAYRILKLQKGGKRPMSAEEFLRGQEVPKGLLLS